MNLRIPNGKLCLYAYKREIKGHVQVLSSFPLSVFYTGVPDLLHKYVNCSPNMFSVEDIAVQKQMYCTVGKGY